VFICGLIYNYSTYFITYHLSSITHHLSTLIYTWCPLW
jgi:hypothetical protein